MTFSSLCFTANTLAIAGIIATDGMVDPECQPLWNALTAMPGVEVIAACSGHGTQPLRVWFTVGTLSALRPILLGMPDAWQWRCEILAHCSCCPVRCLLTSRAYGPTAGQEAQILASYLDASLLRYANA